MRDNPQTGASRLSAEELRQIAADAELPEIETDRYALICRLLDHADAQNGHIASLTRQIEAVDIMRMLWEFHEHLDLPRSNEPTSAPGGTVLGRIEIMGQEWQELKDALSDGDLVEIADALGDLVYGVFGTAATYGIDLNAVITEIHRSNMTKDKPTDSNGKAVKGPDYEPPRIAQVIASAAQEQEDTCVMSHSG